MIHLTLPLSRLIQWLTNWWYLFSSFSKKIGLDISCKLSPWETVCMKCQSLFSGKNKYKCSLRKDAYSNTLKILSPKNENFQIKNSDSCHISTQNIDWRYSLELPQWGSSNEYPQSMFLSRIKKNNVYPCKPQFYYIKVGFKGVKIK